MLELVTLVWLCVAVFAVVGLGRGWTKEIIAMAGITLGLFALHQFDAALRGQLLTQFSRPKQVSGADGYTADHRLFRLSDTRAAEQRGAVE